MKKKLLLSLALLAIAGTEVSLQAGKGGAVAGGLIGGMALGSMISNSNNNRGRTVYVRDRYDDSGSKSCRRENARLRREVARLENTIADLEDAQS